MTELSPAAQAIKAAVLLTYDSRVRRDDALWRLEQPGVVAALRAAASQLREAYANEEPIQADDWLDDLAAELSPEADPTMPDFYALSPAAQAVMDAAGRRYAVDGDLQDSIAAALRAAADQVVPREAMKDPLWASDAYRQRADTRAYLLALAAELSRGRP